MTETKTRVVCVKVSDIRPKYQNLENWMSDPNNVYIARGGIVYIEKNGKKYRFPDRDSIWANPYKISDTIDRNKAIDMYRTYITTKIKNGTITNQQLEELRGKNLGCWCKENGKDIPCHGDVILELLGEK